MATAVESLFAALEAIVRESGTWQEKKNKILEEASEDDKTNLYEFIAWFE